MVYNAHVKQGTVVFDEPITLPEGVAVQVEVLEGVASPKTHLECTETAGQRLLKFAGKAIGLSSDAAENHDHYLYGTPKR